MIRSRAAGVTLIELMVTIAIVAILLAVAFPSFEGSMRSNRVATTSNELLALLSLARSEAIRNPNGAVLCTSINGTACGGGWNNGWMVWIDTDDDKFLDAGERVVRYVQGNPRLTISSAGPTQIEFDSRGRANAPRVIDLQPTTCPTGVELVRQLNVSATGQVRIDRSACT